MNCEPTSYGCRGGFPEDAMDFLFNVGTSLSDDVPYTGVQNTSACPAKKPLVKINSLAYYETYKGYIAGTQGATSPNGNCTRLRQLLAYVGPVVARINVDNGFYQYQSGPYTSSTW